MKRQAVDAETLAQLADYECPECGPLVDGGATLFSEAEAHAILGGDERGFIRCPDCGAELESTLEASLGMLKLIAERHPEIGQQLADGSLTERWG